MKFSNGCLIADVEMQVLTSLNGVPSTVMTPMTMPRSDTFDTYLLTLAWNFIMIKEPRLMTSMIVKAHDICQVQSIPVKINLDD